MSMPDRWTTVEAIGAALLGGGVWALWGAAWACMLWGSMLLGLSMLRAYMLLRPERREVDE